MNLDEYIDAFGRKKKKRKLREIIVDEITLCESPANRKTFMILKGKRMDEIIKLIKEFVGSEFEIGKAVDLAGVKKALKTLLQYGGDLPDELKSSLDTILKSAFSYPAQKSQGDNFPSIPIVAPQSVLEKMSGFEDFDDDDGNDDDEFNDEWG